VLGRQAETMIKLFIEFRQNEIDLTILEIPSRPHFVAGETLFRQNNVDRSSEHDFASIPCEDETKDDEDSWTIVF
jgi:hypothetical protein